VRANEEEEVEGETARGSPLARFQVIIGCSRKVYDPPSNELVMILPRS